MSDAISLDRSLHRGSSVLLDRLEQFDAAWRGGAAPPLEAFLPPPGDTARRELLEELVPIDLEYRWRQARSRPAEAAGVPTLLEAGRQRPAQEGAPPGGPRLEDYVGRFPELGPPESLPGKLVGEEYRARQRWGDRPGHAEYLARFPGRAAAVREALARIDAELAAEPPGPGPAPRGDEGGRAGPALPGQAGHCRIVGELARGGMGVILQGHDEHLDRDLAVKVLRDTYRNQPDAVRRFLAEAQVSGQLQHPGIVPVHELGRFADGRPYFTMKLVQGRTLAELLAQRQDPAQDRPHLLKVFEQVCQTVAYAHSKGVIHRDLKPANVMVGAFGEVQVMDWGLAKRVGRERQGEDGPGCPSSTPPPADA
jgi:hypothetical protein